MPKGDFRNKDILFTDGASKGNPGSSGWGVVKLTADRQVHELGGYERYASNNQMELTAAVRALLAVSRKNKTILITDSNNNLYYKIIDKYYLNSLLIKLRRYQNEIIYIKIKTLYNLFFF